MTYDAEVRAALLPQLKTVVAEELIAQENKQFDPFDGKPWVRETLIPGAPARVEIMQGGKSRQFGVYQIDVFTPVSIGTGVADAMAKAITEVFVPGTGYIAGDVTVRIQRAYATRGREDGNWYQKPVVIDWWIMEE